MSFFDQFAPKAADVSQSFQAIRGLQLPVPGFIKVLNTRGEKEVLFVSFRSVSRDRCLAFVFRPTNVSRIVIGLNRDWAELGCETADSTMCANLRVAMTQYPPPRLVEV